MNFTSLVQQHYSQHIKNGNTPESIVIEMGYTSKRIPIAILRLNDVISSPVLGFESTRLDFKYSHREFVEKALSIIEIPASKVKIELDKIQHALYEESIAFDAYIFVETGFKRTTESIMALGALNSQRYLKIGKAWRYKPFNDQIELAQKMIIEHYTTQSGELGIWGTIQHYVFYYDIKNGKTARIYFNNQGKQIKNKNLKET